MSTPPLRSRGAAVPPSPVPADWHPALPYVVVGSLLIVAGGLAAAVGSALQWERAAWVAAYVVLVGGVAQIALGVGRVLLAAAAPTPAERWAELLAWNGGAAAVLIGDLARALPLVVLGSAALLVALGLFFAGVRRGGRRVRSRWVLAAYDAGVVVLLASVVIGTLLAPGPP